MKHGYCKYLDHITLEQMKYYVVHVNREFKQQRQHRRRKHHLKIINIRERATIFDFYFFLASFVADNARCKWTGRSSLK